MTQLVDKQTKGIFSFLFVSGLLLLCIWSFSFSSVSFSISQEEKTQKQQQSSFIFNAVNGVLTYNNDNDNDNDNVIIDNSNIVCDRNSHEDILNDGVKKAIDEYIHYHQETILHKKYNDKDVKFIVYIENLGGIGNHILPIVSTFLYGMITRRIVLVHDITVTNVKIFEELFEQPMLWEMSKVLAKMNAPERDVKKIFDNEELTYSATIRHTFYENDWNYLYCDDFNATKHKFVKIFSNQYYAPIMLHNHNYMDAWKKLFDSSDSHSKFDSNIYNGNMKLFSEIARYLFVPKQEIRDTIAAFKRDHFGSTTIGIQLRKEFVNFPEWETRWEECALFAADEFKLLVSNNDHDTNDNNANNDKNDKKRDDLVFFLASDINASTIAAKWKGRNIVTLQKLLGRTADSQIDAIVDMYLLSLCDAIVATEHSTFGSSAVALGNHIPYVVTRSGKCRRYTTSEPHCHFCDQFVPNLPCHDPQLWYTSFNTVEG